MSRRSSHPTRAETLLRELKDAASRCGIVVREERLLREVGYRVYGGRCRVRGRDTVFLDRSHPPAQRVETLLASLAGEDLGQAALSARLRRLLA